MLRKIKSQIAEQPPAKSLRAGKLQSSRLPNLCGQEKRLSLCLLSAVSLISSFPKFNLWILAWIGFVPLFFALDIKHRQQAFLLSYLCGIIFWLGTIYWLIHVTFLGMIVLVLYLALYFGIFGLIISRYRLLRNPYSLLVIPSLWVILEYLRAHILIGFPWGLIAYSQCSNLAFIQIADVVGAYGVSFLMMVVNLTIYELASKGRMFSSLRLFTVGLMLLLSFSYGFLKLHKKIVGPKIKVSIIQGNIPQEEKWDEARKDFILSRYIDLTSKVKKDNPQLIIWPETAIPGYLIEEPNLLLSTTALAKRMEIPLLVGSVVERIGKTYNSAILISSSGELIEEYDKLHLVPFGEYIPRPFPFLRKFVDIGDFSPGANYTIFRLPVATCQLPTKFGVLICFEDVFPELARGFAKRGAHFLINITNDAWFGKTSSPYQHTQASIFRAIETRLPVVRCANTGLSCFIDAKGRLSKKVSNPKGEDVFIAGFATADIILSEMPTFYVRFGDAFLVVCLIFLTSFIFRGLY